MTDNSKSRPRKLTWGIGALALAALLATTLLVFGGITIAKVIIRGGPREIVHLHDDGSVHIHNPGAPGSGESVAQMESSGETAAHGHEDGHAPAGMLTAGELEEQYGLRVTLIGVTAGGGLVDLRFKVLDAAKANKLLSSHDNMPQLVPEGSKTRLGIPGMHTTTYQTGRTYYMLYGNAGGIVRPGTPVQVAFGDLVMEEIAAR